MTARPRPVLVLLAVLVVLGFTGGYQTVAVLSASGDASGTFENYEDIKSGTERSKVGYYNKP
ncbi:hypothetical protein [Natronococcus amylolyticus]|uniref:hypothetical protein n=1 Tax=Natronococcus amylolyticus TaxID=44470 RepID=UPI001360B28A|nr:hypothetical protein [Natronococcus amylolyticus]